MGVASALVESLLCSRVRLVLSLPPSSSSAAHELGSGGAAADDDGAPPGGHLVYAHGAWRRARVRGKQAPSSASAGYTRRLIACGLRSNVAQYGGAVAARAHNAIASSHHCIASLCDARRGSPYMSRSARASAAVTHTHRGRDAA